jgi:hypothetical protein
MGYTDCLDLGFIVFVGILRVRKKYQSENQAANGRIGVSSAFENSRERDTRDWDVAENGTTNISTPTASADEVRVIQHRTHAKGSWLMISTNTSVAVCSPSAVSSSVSEPQSFDSPITACTRTGVSLS